MVYPIFVIKLHVSQSLVFGEAWQQLAGVKGQKAGGFSHYRCLNANA